MSRKGILYIISAPSGAGKTTLFKMILEYFKDLHPSISHTTRPIRAGEMNGKDYFFIDDATFDEMVKNKKFVEWAHVHKNKYGTSYEFIDKFIKLGEDLLFDIDIQGAENMKKLFPDAVLIFLVPPSFSSLENRLAGRNTDDSENIKLRMENARREIKEINKFDYLVINDHLIKAFEELKAVIISRRLIRQKNEFDIEKYLNI